MTDPVPIRLARSPDIPQMQAIEIAAGRLFAETRRGEASAAGWSTPSRTGRVTTASRR